MVVAPPSVVTLVAAVEMVDVVTSTAPGENVVIRLPVVILCPAIVPSMVTAPVLVLDNVAE